MGSGERWCRIVFREKVADYLFDEKVLCSNMLLFFRRLLGLHLETEYAMISYLDRFIVNS